VLSLVTVHSANRVWLIYLVMFLYGVSGAITNAAFNGLKEQLMPKELFGEANGLSQAAQQGVRLITPALGLGLLAAFGGPALAIMDAGTFVVGLIAWSLVRIDDPKPQRPEQAETWWQESTGRLPLPVPHARAAPAHDRAGGGLLRHGLLRDAGDRGRDRRPAPLPHLGGRAGHGDGRERARRRPDGGQP
jgi:hypothetical protein